MPLASPSSNSFSRLSHPAREEDHLTMHRQQRLRSPSSSPSSQSLPRFSTSRSSVSSVLLAPATSASTATSAPTSTPTPALTATAAPAPVPVPVPTIPTPTKPIASATGPTSSIVLPTSSTWSTSKLPPYVWNVQQTSCSSLALLSNESSIASSSPSTITLPVPCPRLVSVLAWSMTLLLVTSCIGLTDAGILNGHPLGKRSFIDIQCKGIYDKSIFARLDRICEDCYNLFREPQLHQLCRKNCFTSDYFKGCLDVLLLQDEVEKIQTWIKQLHGAEPGV
ncbi:ion transport peptide isoform X2 [Augochlora pura]